MKYETSTTLNVIPIENFYTKIKGVKIPIGTSCDIVKRADISDVEIRQSILNVVTSIKDKKGVTVVRFRYKGEDVFQIVERENIRESPIIHIKKAKAYVVDEVMKRFSWRVVDSDDCTNIIGSVTMVPEIEHKGYFFSVNLEEYGKMDWLNNRRHTLDACVETIWSKYNEIIACYK